MAEGDLTATDIGVFDVGTDGVIEAAISGANLALVTDFLYIINIGNGQARIIKIEREGAA
jgi:hypothetical protein